MITGDQPLAADRSAVQQHETLNANTIPTIFCINESQSSGGVKNGSRASLACLSRYKIQGKNFPQNEASLRASSKRGLSLCGEASRSLKSNRLQRVRPLFR